MKSNETVASASLPALRVFSGALQRPRERCGCGRGRGAAAPGGLGARARDGAPGPARRRAAAARGPRRERGTRPQVLLKFAGIVIATAVLDFWLGEFGCTSVFEGVFNTFTP